ncbi:RWD domain-containing protein 4-like protein [Plakobranchus ocellatus]|uniref:RWD domain-containing protein 4-like protein n=1 Tax=Plakobranchus ocellatus TaxID=259542 RepID=A0AAV4BB54_9GAST|nr:RWD domain-containing protein 4-like protein [Plakobranchus ocellatus]
MSSTELQEEELEVLRSIYDGDPCFKALNDTVFQYKYGEDGSYKSFIVEVSWSPAYPEELPTINMDAFYNNHIIQTVKDAVKTGVLQQAEELLGMSMTFSLFEWVKDNLDTLLAEQPEAPVVQPKATVTASEEKSPPVSTPKEKKETLSKSQKRRMFDRFGATMDKPRGWNWVDIIKHLSQTGSQKQDE